MSRHLVEADANFFESGQQRAFLIKIVFYSDSRPAVIADITNAVSYPNANLPATALVKPEIRDDAAVYPPEDVRRRFYVDIPAPPDYERARTRAWTRLKSGR